MIINLEKEKPTLKYPIGKNNCIFCGTFIEDSDYSIRIGLSKKLTPVLYNIFKKMDNMFGNMPYLLSCEKCYYKNQDKISNNHHLLENALINIQQMKKISRQENLTTMDVLVYYFVEKVLCIK